MRDASPALLAGVAESVLRPVILASLDWPSGVVRLNSTPYDVVMDGATYRGIGDLGAISPVEEGTDAKSYGITLALTGIRPEYIAEVTSTPIQGRPLTLWWGLLDADHRMTVPPVQIFGGRMDVATIEIGTLCSIAVSAESRLVDWERPRVRRYTHEDQQAAYPDDMGLQYVVTMSEIELVWGR